jgi:signal transduction histidine kinase
LKNPLTAVSSVIDLLLMNERHSEEDQVGFMKRALDSCRDMNDQIEGLLAIHKMENAGLMLQRTLVDMASVVSAVMDEFQLRAESRGITFPARPWMICHRRTLTADSWRG